MPIDFIAADIIFCRIHAAARQFFVPLLSSVSLLSIPTKANKEDSPPISPLAEIANSAKVKCNFNCNILLYLCYATSLGFVVTKLPFTQGKTHIVMFNHIKFEYDPRRVVLF